MAGCLSDSSVSLTSPFSLKYTSIWFTKICLSFVSSISVETFVSPFSSIRARAMITSIFSTSSSAPFKIASAGKQVMLRRLKLSGLMFSPCFSRHDFKLRTCRFFCSLVLRFCHKGCSFSGAIRPSSLALFVS